MEDEFDPPPEGQAVAGAAAWILVPFVIGRLADANVSTVAGDWARPMVVIAMLCWAMYRPAHSPVKLALLVAIELLLTIGLVASALGVVAAVVIAGFDLRSVNRLAWLLLAGIPILAGTRALMVRWVRRDAQREGREAAGS